MSPEEALAFLDTIARNAVMTRDGHARAIEAVKVLSAALQPKQETPNDAE